MFGFGGFGELMSTARTGAGELNLGGATLQGGVGGVDGGVLGALFVTMLSNLMDLLEVGGYLQQILPGCVIILAMFLDRLRRART